MYYKCHKIILNNRGSYVDSPDWIKSKKATIIKYLKKIIELIYEEIGKHAEMITKIKRFYE